MLASSIRLADASDLTEVAACVREAYTHYFGRIGREPAPMGADYADLIARNLVYVLADPGGTVRGVLVMLHEQHALFIENIAVHPRYQRAGLGRSLMAFAEAQARTAGLRELRLYTNVLMTENIAFYQRLGFEETDRRLDHGFQRVFMRKLLQSSAEDSD
jgi:ribosomal protein S18 acetylase RimI-like enzyme